MVDAMYELGMETGWEADVVKSFGRFLIVLDGVVVGEIQGDGQRVMYPQDQQYPFTGEED